ncbi:MAG: cytidine deaminase [Clostridia bacterium]|nr:cytidine deaminase [Candidatus Pelethousia sp.]NCB32019.1 cytidine deaminase [Clostridia bacterium]
MSNIHEFEARSMVRMATEARSRAYVPYSNFRVGACLKASNGAYYMGCNIENAAYSPSICAERSAIFKAVYEGERDFDALAIIWDGENYAMPCGVCRQVLSEFCDAEMPVVCANRTGEYRIFALGELLPEAFSARDMQ